MVSLGKPSTTSGFSTSMLVYPRVRGDAPSIYIVFLMRSSE